MRAIVVEKGRPAELRQLADPDAGPGDVVVDVTWSGVNYKDGLALRGDPGVARVDHDAFGEAARLRLAVARTVDQHLVARRET